MVVVCQCGAWCGVWCQWCVSVVHGTLTHAVMVVVCQCGAWLCSVVHTVVCSVVHGGV